jgi:amino acid transporter
MIVLGTLVMLSFMMIVWRGARAAMILSWIGVITGTLGHLAFDVGVLTGGGLPAFIERWNAMSGTTYQAVLDAANAGGWNTGYVSMTVSLGAGITYVALNTLGSTYTANIMGEIKEVRKSAILAMLGALVLFLIYWEVFYSVAYYGFGRDFWAAMAYFAPAGAGAGTWEGWPFRAYSFIPMPQFLLVYLNPNVAYSVVCSVCFGICTYASCMGLAFGTVRNLFAYSFDRVLPTFFSKTDKRGSPWSAVLLGAIIVWIFFIIMVYAAMWVAYSILAWFFAWAIVGIVGMVFPYSKRGKAIFEKSPELVKKKIGGVPILFIFGLLTFIISVAIDYFMLVPFFQGLIDATFIWMTVFMFIIPAFVIYYISRAYHKAKGVPMELQFREVPPD